MVKKASKSKTTKTKAKAAPAAPAAPPAPVQEAALFLRSNSSGPVYPTFGS